MVKQTPSQLGCPHFFRLILRHLERGQRERYNSLERTLLDLENQSTSHPTFQLPHLDTIRQRSRFVEDS